MSDPLVDWRQLREFAGVDLDSSFVLSWSVDGESLLLDVDLQLTPAHPFYDKPRPKQKACIRAALIEFPYCDRVGLDGDVLAPAEAVARLPLGRIVGLQLIAEGRYEVSGEFGSVTIDAERPLVRLKEH